VACRGFLAPASSTPWQHPYLGWALDAFGCCFVVVFLIDTWQAFQVPRARSDATGRHPLRRRAVHLRMLADRFGRRIPLMVNVLFFSTCRWPGFAPNTLNLPDHASCTESA
jgi:hypothetical protein